jgi:hypothetical protein
MASVIMLRAAMLSIVMPSAILPGVVILNVVAPLFRNNKFRSNDSPILFYNLLHKISFISKTIQLQ